MPNTTDLYWSVNGVSLQTLVQNIETIGGRFSPPPMRGEDITIPYSVGERFLPKTPAARILPLAMWLKGSTADEYDENWRQLRNLLWQPGKQFALQKRIKVGGATRAVTAQGQFYSGLEPKMIGRNAAKFAVDIKLARPFFYDDAFTTFNLVNGNNTVVLPGDYKTTNLEVTINGPRVNPVVWINAEIQVEFHGSIPTGASVKILISTYTAIMTPVGAPQYDASSLIRHAGATQWLHLEPGSNTVNVSSASGAGAVQIQAKGAWI